MAGLTAICSRVSLLALCRVAAGAARGAALFRLFTRSGRGSAGGSGTAASDRPAAATTVEVGIGCCTGRASEAEDVSARWAAGSAGVPASPVTAVGRNCVGESGGRLCTDVGVMTREATAAGGNSIGVRELGLSGDDVVTGVCLTPAYPNSIVPLRVLRPRRAACPGAPQGLSAALAACPAS